MKITNFNVDRVYNEMQLIVEKTKIFGSILCSEEGLIIIDTFNNNSIYNTETISAMAASMISEHNYGYIPPQEIILSYENDKIVIRKILSPKKHLDLILISIVPHDLRYYRRYVNKIIKIINKNI